MTKINSLVSPSHRAVLESKLAPVYMHYRGQGTPQPAFIYIEPTVLPIPPVYADYVAEISGIPMIDWTGERRSISIPAEAIGTSIIAFIDQHADLFQRVIDGEYTEHDGISRHWYLTGDAVSALERLEALAVKEIDVARVYAFPADLWLDDEITADTDPQELAGDYLAARDNNVEMWVFELAELVEYIEERKAELFPEV